MFKSPFSLEGRIRRSEYALSFFIYILGIFICMGLLLIINSSAVLPIIMLPLWWLMLAQSVKRSHDIGNSGWFILIPFYNFLLFFWEGEKGGNKYGPDPKTGEDDFVPDNIIKEETVEAEKVETPKVLVNRTYQSDLGELIIEQELSQPNIGERAFMDGKPADSNKYKVGFMNYIHIENGVVTQLTMF